MADAAPAHPDLSVVIPSVNGWDDLGGCLDALYAQRGDAELEILVADRLGEEVRRHLESAPPSVRLIAAPPGTTIPRLRELAFDRARAPVVGVIEDHVIVPPDWAERMLAQHRAGARVVAGSVDNAARDRLVEWASFLCEYSQCLAPVEGPAEWLPGNNTTYDAELLREFRDVVAEGRWEDRLHEAFREGGIELLSRPEIEVGHKKHFTFPEYLSQRYLYARSYAGGRVAGQGVGAKLVHALKALALPPVLAARIAGGVWGSGRYRGHLVRSLPMIGVFVLSWSVGELVGALAGPGDALERVT